jgi:5'(3')-deoxyribonucleotidase
MDGVLVNFEKGYLDLTGIDTSTYIKGDAAFWAPIDAEGPMFWANLEWMPDGHRLWSYIQKYKPFILSSPSRSTTSKIGKEAWLKINIPNQYRKALFYPRHEKQLFAAPNHILIDDMKSTIDEWNKAGGIGIHHTSAVSTILKLKSIGL